MMLDERELKELESTFLSGVTVGIGSQILILGNGSSVLVQCPFECEGEEGVFLGHGEDPRSSLALFVLLNASIESARCNDEGLLELNFEGRKSLRIRAERNGFESYVVNTKFGISPVSIA